ncbi:MAG: UvrD-helicase domain-containing protein, partial [Phycisphaerales bacterium]
MSTFNRFEVVEALAGAGKTFKLSNRYLRLIVQGADPASILATTFSVKAAGEIRDRIIQSVALAIDDKSAREVLFEGVPELERTREACVDLLRMIIADLHRLQIGTIDSFFVKTAKLFGDELGFPTSWTILD